MNAADDTGPERDIDLTRWRQAVVSRWWIVAAGLAAGLVLGALYSLSGGSVWEASVLLAPSQAFSPNGSPVLSYQSSPRNINDLATEEGTLLLVTQQVAKTDHLHVPVSDLRGHVSTSTLSTGLGSSTASRGSQLIKITVQLPKAKEAAAAANALGSIIATESTSKYVTQSIGVLKKDLEGNTAQLESVAREVKAFNKLLNPPPANDFEALLLTQQADNALLREGTLNDKIEAQTQQLTLTQSIEQASIVGPSAVAAKTTARSRRNSILVGLLLGLIIGGIAAIVADSRLRRPS